MNCPKCGGYPAGEASGGADICQCSPMFDLFLCWRHKVAILSSTLRQAATALEKARPSVKARAVESADDDQYDDLVGEINRVLFRIKELNLP